MVRKNEKNSFLLLILLCTLVGLLGFSMLTQAKAQSFSWGSSGNTVISIQTKLKNWGYYSGTVDGKYGYQTWEAVKYFQQKNGLIVDGIVGKSTLVALGIQTTSTSSSNANRDRDVNLLAAVIHAEARGEPYVGQVAVGAVVLNRIKHPSFPNSISNVVYQAGAFDCVADGQINLTPSTTSVKAAKDALSGWDPTKGAIYYYNPKTATNKWILSIPITFTSGNHVFGKK